MTVLKEESLDTIKGGATTITGTIISALVDVFELIRDAGIAVGSGIRRISEDQLCPLK